MLRRLAAVPSWRLFLLLLSAVLFSTGALASPAARQPGSIKIISRQAATLSQDQACLQYARVANLSAVGTNSTLRTTFLDVSPVGTLYSSAMLNQAMVQLPALTADAQLNQACGNLTTVATTEAANNFTRGIVLQFTFTGNHGSIVNGPIMIFVTLAAVLSVAGTASAL